MADTSDETTLLGLAKSGQHDAVEAILTRYSGLVKALSRRYFLPGGDHEDVVQEGMLGLFKAIRDFEPGAGASSGNFAVLCIRRQMITAVKTSTRQKHLPLNGALSLECPLHGGDSDQVMADRISDRLSPGPEERLIDQESIQTMWAFIQRELSPLETTVAICYAQDMGQSEIAATLGIGLKSVDNAPWRVKRKCRSEALDVIQRSVSVPV